MGRSTTMGLVMAAAVAAGCGPSGEGDVLSHAVAQGCWTHVLPPINSGCGTVQPGFDPDTYSPFADDFCTVAVTYCFEREGEQTHWDWWLYVLDMGEPDPAVELPEHLAAMWPAAQESALYCHFRWNVAPEPVGSYDASDIQHLTMTLEEVSHYCSVDYTPSGYVPGETYAGYLIDSSDPDVVLFLDEPRLEDQPSPELSFQGLIGVSGTGGWSPTETNAGGWTFHYRACSPSPSSDGMGPGFCADTCRYFSGDGDRPACGWEHVRALPSNPALVDSDWRTSYSASYDEVYGAP